jgi:hypothetical protein
MMRHDDKLLEYRFPMVYIKLICSFLINGKFYFTFAGEMSAQCGVPSGGHQSDDSALFNVIIVMIVSLEYNQKILFYMAN